MLLMLLNASAEDAKYPGIVDPAERMVVGPIREGVQFEENYRRLHADYVLAAVDHKGAPEQRRKFRQAQLREIFDPMCVHNDGSARHLAQLKTLLDAAKDPTNVEARTEMLRIAKLYIAGTVTALEAPIARRDDRGNEYFEVVRRPDAPAEIATMKALEAALLGAVDGWAQDETILSKSDAHDVFRLLQCRRGVPGSDIITPEDLEMKAKKLNVSVPDLIKEFLMPFFDTGRVTWRAEFIAKMEDQEKIDFEREVEAYDEHRYDIVLKQLESLQGLVETQLPEGLVSEVLQTVKDSMPPQYKDLLNVMLGGPTAVDGLINDIGSLATTDNLRLLWQVVTAMSELSRKRNIVEVIFNVDKIDDASNNWAQYVSAFLTGVKYSDFSGAVELAHRIFWEHAGDKKILYKQEPEYRQDMSGGEELELKGFHNVDDFSRQRNVLWDSVNGRTLNHKQWIEYQEKQRAIFMKAVGEDSNDPKAVKKFEQSPYYVYAWTSWPDGKFMCSRSYDKGYKILEKSEYEAALTVPEKRTKLSIYEEGKWDTKTMIQNLADHGNTPYALEEVRAGARGMLWAGFRALLNIPKVMELSVSSNLATVKLSPSVAKIYRVLSASANQFINNPVNQPALTRIFNATVGRFVHLALPTISDTVFYMALSSDLEDKDLRGWYQYLSALNPESISKVYMFMAFINHKSSDEIPLMLQDSIKYVADEVEKKKNEWKGAARLKKDVEDLILDLCGADGKSGRLHAAVARTLLEMKPFLEVQDKAFDYTNQRMLAQQRKQEARYLKEKKSH